MFYAPLVVSRGGARALIRCAHMLGLRDVTANDKNDSKHALKALVWRIAHTDASQCFAADPQ